MFRLRDVFVHCLVSFSQFRWTWRCVWFGLWNPTVLWTPRMSEFRSWLGSLCGQKCCANGIALVCPWYHVCPWMSTSQICQKVCHPCPIRNGVVVSHTQSRVRKHTNFCSQCLSGWFFRETFFQDDVSQFCQNEIPQFSEALFMRCSSVLRTSFNNCPCSVNLMVDHSSWILHMLHRHDPELDPTDLLSHWWHAQIKMCRQFLSVWTHSVHHTKVLMCDWPRLVVAQGPSLLRNKVH